MSNIIQFKPRQPEPEPEPVLHFICRCGSEEWHIQPENICCVECGNKVGALEVYGHVLNGEEKEN